MRCFPHISWPSSGRWQTKEAFAPKTCFLPQPPFGKNLGWGRVSSPYKKTKYKQTETKIQNLKKEIRKCIFSVAPGWFPPRSINFVLLCQRRRCSVVLPLSSSWQQTKEMLKMTIEICFGPKHEKCCHIMAYTYHICVKKNGGSGYNIWEGTQLLLCSGLMGTFLAIIKYLAPQGSFSINFDKWEHCNNLQFLKT